MGTFLDFLKNLGTEPLEENNLGQYLYKKSHTRSIGIKPFLMDSKVVVGVGNIYATEVLFKIGIHPETTCSKITLSDYKKIGRAIQSILNESIKQGGTTLSDFYNSDGSPGLFKRELKVYGKENEPCKYCSHLIQRIVQSQRSSWFCPVCQKLKI